MKKKCIIISIEAKIFGKMQKIFYGKYINNLGIEKNFPCLVNEIYEKSTANIIFKGDGLKPSPLRSKTRENACFQLSHEEKQLKDTLIGKGKVRLSLFAHVMSLYL